MHFFNIPYKLILASKSPRRQQLLSELGLHFESRSKEVEEDYPENLKREEIALFLSEKKAAAFKTELAEQELLITSDTIVCKGNEVLNKPKDTAEAFKMLSNLSNTFHEVITAVSLTSKHKQISFFSDTKVFFRELSADEINYYIEHFQPFDKAGAYGIQEWIGMIGIEKIHGSFYNVMGLPVDRLFEELRRF